MNIKRFFLFFTLLILPHINVCMTYKNQEGEQVTYNLYRTRRGHERKLKYENHSEKLVYIGVISEEHSRKANLIVGQPQDSQTIFKNIVEFEAGQNAITQSMAQACLKCIAKP